MADFNWFFTMQWFRIKFLILLVFTFVLFGAGYIDTIDADPSILTAKSLVENAQWMVTPSRNPDLYARAWDHEGGWYSKMGLVHPVLYVPLVLLARVAAPTTGIAEAVLVPFFCSFLNAFLTSLLVLLLFECLQKRGWSKREALAIACLAGFTTLLLPYSKTAHREPMLALSLVGTFAFTLSGYFFWAALAAGLGILTKLGMVLPLAPLLAFATVRAKRSAEPVCATLLLLAPLGIAVLTQAGFSYLAWGSPFGTGYSTSVTHLRGDVWTTPIWKGVWAQLLSPSTGLWIYSPIVALCFLALFQRAYQRKTAIADWVIVLVALFQIGLHAAWRDPLGGECLGPRYTVPLIPLFFFWLVPGCLPKTQWGRLSVATVIGFSLLLQLTHTMVKPQQYWNVVYRANQSIPVPHWWSNLVFAKHKLFGREERYSLRDFGLKTGTVDLGDVPSLQGVNFWWAHLARDRYPAQIRLRRVPPFRAYSLTAEETGETVTAWCGRDCTFVDLQGRRIVTRSATTGSSHFGRERYARLTLVDGLTGKEIGDGLYDGEKKVATLRYEGRKHVLRLQEEALDSSERSSN